MRLRTRLATLFGLIALAPLLVIVPFAAQNLHRTLTRELERRADRAAAAAGEELARTAGDIRRSLDELTASLPLDADVKAGSAGEWMPRFGLTVLTLLDAHGTTLSSGHLPARTGDLDAELFPLTRLSPRPPLVQEVQVREGPLLLRRPALLELRAAESSAGRLWVVGGAQLDPAFAAHLARLTGASVSILSRGKEVARAGEAPEHAVVRTLALSPEVSLVLALSRSTVSSVERGLAGAAAGVVTLGLALAVLLGFAVAGVVTRPVEALAAGARRVAAGDWETRVEAPAQGELALLIGSFNEMTQTLRATTARLVSAERIAAWQEIAQRLAHELKNPLTPIQMSLETLVAAQRQKSPRFETLFAESSFAMLEEVERLRRTVDAFSSFARLPRPQTRTLAVPPWIRQVVALHAPAEGGRVEVRCELIEGLEVTADRDQLTQVLVNLLKNGREAMAQGGTLTVRTRRAPGEVWLEVEDQGPGVAEGARAQLFTPYFTTKPNGTGLGLALSSRICEEHGGSLELAPTAPGRGACFRVRLPAPGA